MNNNYNLQTTDDATRNNTDTLGWNNFQNNQVPMDNLHSVQTILMKTTKSHKHDRLDNIFVNFFLKFAN